MPWLDQQLARHGLVDPNATQPTWRQRLLVAGIAAVLIYLLGELVAGVDASIAIALAVGVAAMLIVGGLWFGRTAR